jgi:hypothetical protein
MTTESQPPAQVPVPEPEEVTLDPALVVARRQQAANSSAAADEEGSYVAQVVAAVERAAEQVNAEPQPPAQPAALDFTLAIDPTALGEQLDYLATLQHRERHPLLEGVLNFMRGLAEQAYARYGINATLMSDAALLQSLAERWAITPDELVSSVRASAELMVDRQVRDGNIAGQVAFLTEQWGPDATRRILQTKYQERASAAAQNNPPPVQTSAQPVPAG